MSSSLIINSPYEPPSQYWVPARGRRIAQSFNQESMKLIKATFKNIGPIKSAELELGDLTIIAGQNNTGRSKFTKNLKAEINEDLIETYRGTISLPFELGENSRVAVKIADDRGIESLKVIEVRPMEAG